jgi:outer membrane murein-binding lipoprotein Lpp
MKNRWMKMTGCSMIALTLILVGCSSERKKNQAKEAAARYWQDKAYPGKSFDIQVIEAEKAEGGSFRVKGIVDGETRVGTFNPDTETFSEGYYSLAHERNKKIAELEQEVKYLKEKLDGLEKENYKLKVKLDMGKKEEGSTKTSP